MASLSGCVKKVGVFWDYWFLGWGLLWVFRNFSCSCTVPRVWFCDKNEGLSCSVMWRCVAGLIPISLYAAV